MLGGCIRISSSVSVADIGELAVKVGELIQPTLNLVQRIGTAAVDVFVAQLDHHLSEPANRPHDENRIVRSAWWCVPGHTPLLLQPTERLAVVNRGQVADAPGEFFLIDHLNTVITRLVGLAAGVLSHDDQCRLA